VNRLRSLIAATLVLAAFPAVAPASPTQESMFQDDPLLVYGTPAGVDSTLDRLAEFGVDRIRVSVFWRNVAPANDLPQKPLFDAADPAQYPAVHWEPYDRLIRSAMARGILVNLNFTSPIPRWAAGTSPDEKYQETFQPNPKEFGDFVRAVAKRYSGTYMGLPRVDYWSIWNEPNQAGWLTPQWAPDPRDASKQVEAAPAIYRNLVREAWTALADTGHGTDTILIGETAPAGQKKLQGINQSIDALRFIRQVYCLDDNFNTLKAQEAEVRGCPVSGAQFVTENPGLFKAKGYAHHPYEQLRQPDKTSSWPDWVTMANLGDLSSDLRRIYRRYGQPLPTKRGVPLYLTEYGYQTKPDPFTISFARQAAWLNQAEYIAYANKNVRAFSQFLLVDDAPVPDVSIKTNPRLAWRTFQSGLVLQTGKKKPSYKAYATPIFLKQSRVRRLRGIGVFALLRGAKPGTRPSAQVQFRARGRKRWRTVRSLRVGGARHYLEVRVRVPRTGLVRVRWLNGKKAVVSRAAPVTIVG